MAVLNRKLFNRGGRVSSRGVGITSGLVPRYSHGGPVSEHTSVIDKYKDNFEMLQSLGITPERKPFSKLAAASPALLELGGKLLSGRSLQGGVTGGLDILGQAATAAAPGFAQAIQERREYDAADPEASLREMALQMALEKDDDIEYSDPTEVKIKFEGSDDTVNALRSFDKKNNIFVYQTPDGDKIDQEKNPFTVIRDTEKANWSNPKNVKVLLDNNVKADAIRTFNSATNVFSWYIPSADKTLKAGTFTEIDDGTGSAYKDATNVKLIAKGDESGQTVDAVRVLDGNAFKFVDPTNNNSFDMKKYDIYEDDLTEDEVKEVLDGEIIYKGKSKKVDFVRDESGVKIVDFRPTINNKPNPNFAKPVNINTIDGITGFNFKPKKEVLDVDEQVQLALQTADAKEQAEYAGNASDTIRSQGNKANEIIADTQAALTFLPTSGEGSFIEGRTGFIRLLNTFGVNEAFPDLYATAEGLLLDGKLPSTETSIALAKQLTLGRATEWAQQLNNTEVGLLIDAGPQVGLTKQGQELLLKINLKDAEIKRDALAMMDDLIFNEKKTMFEAVTKVNEFKNEEYKKFSDSIKDDINKVLDYKGVRDLSFFEQQEPIEIKGKSVNLADAYEANKIKFAGYADENGVFKMTLKSGTVLERRVGQKNLPVYILEHEGKGYALEGGTKVIE